MSHRVASSNHAVWLHCRPCPKSLCRTCVSTQAAPQSVLALLPYAVPVLEERLCFQQNKVPVRVCVRGRVYVSVCVSVCVCVCAWAWA